MALKTKLFDSTKFLFPRQSLVGKRVSPTTLQGKGYLGSCRARILLFFFFFVFFALCKNYAKSQERGKPNDFIPDVILGKADFGETVPNQVTGNRVFLPAGITVDRNITPNRIYVWDSGNSRILGFSSLGVCLGGKKVNNPCTNDLDCPSSTCKIIPDKKADLIFGQPDEFHAACNGDSTIRSKPNAATLCSQRYPYQISLTEGPEPNNMAVDNNHNLYVVDKWNQRVLKYNDPFSEDKSGGKGDTIADQVWGQPDFTSKGCNRSSIEGQSCAVVNNPTQNSVCFDCHEIEVTLSEFNGSGLDVDQNGENIYVADGANHRVIRFPVASGFPKGNSNADLVIGQKNFSSRDSRSCVNYPTIPSGDFLCRPKVARFNPLTKQLFILDWPEEIILFRILIYNQPFSNGMQPSEIIYGSPRDEYKNLINKAGQANWSYFRLNRPMGLEIDPFIPNAFWLADTGHSRALYFQKINGKWQPTKVIPQPNLERVDFGGNFNCSNLPFSEHWRCEVNPGGGIGIDAVGNIYLESNIWEQILRFPAPIPTSIPGKVGNEGIGYAADAVFLKQQEKAPEHAGFNFIGPSGIHAPNSVLLVNYKSGKSQLLVDDKNRVLVFDDYQNKKNGAPADHVLFQEDFNSQLDVGALVRQMIVDSKERIWFAREYKGVEVYQGPITSFSKPITTIGSSALPLKNSNQEIILGPIIGLAFDERDDALWVVDINNHRLVRIRYPLDEGKREVDLVLGQPNLQSYLPNRGVDNPDLPPEEHNPSWLAWRECPNMFPDGFGNMNTISLDNYGNLYVVDTSHEGWQCSNNRLLIFYREDIEEKLAQGKVFLDDPNENKRLLPRRIYGASGFSGSARDRSRSEKNRYSRDKYPNFPFSVSFTPDNQMLVIAEAYGNPNYERIYLVSNPLLTCPSGEKRCHVDIEFETLKPGSSPKPKTNYLIPFSIASPVASSFDKEGNLAIIDHTWNRILLFYKPLGDFSREPILSPILTLSPTPTLLSSLALKRGVNKIIWCSGLAKTENFLKIKQSCFFLSFKIGNYFQQALILGQQTVLELIDGITYYLNCF